MVKSIEFIEKDVKKREEFNFEIYVNVLKDVLHFHKLEKNQIEEMLKKKILYFVNNNDKMLSISYTIRIRKLFLEAIRIILTILP